MKKFFSSLKGIYQYLGGCHFVYITIICSLLFTGFYLEVTHLKEDLDSFKEKQTLLNEKQNLLHYGEQQEGVLVKQHHALGEASKIIMMQKETINKLVEEIRRLRRTDIDGWI